MTLLMALQRSCKACDEGWGKGLASAQVNTAGQGRAQAALLFCLVLGWAGAAVAETDPKDTLATMLRQNGYECQEPKSAEPDPAHTTPDRKAWILQCETGRYRVKFKGARGAEITPIAD